MKRPEHLIEGALVASVSAGIVAVAILWSIGRSADPDFPTVAAFDHPAWLAIGEIVGTAAVITAAASLAAVSVFYARSSALATGGVICLGAVVPGVVLITILDLAYIWAAQDGILEAISFSQRWNWWNAVGWLLFAAGGVFGLLAVGSGVARESRELRHPAGALALSMVLTLFVLYAGVLLAASLIWIAAALHRIDLRHSPRPGVEPSSVA